MQHAYDCGVQSRARARGMLLSLVSVSLLSVRGARIPASQRPTQPASPPVCLPTCLPVGFCLCVLCICASVACSRALSASEPVPARVMCHCAVTRSLALGPRWHCESSRFVLPLLYWPASLRTRGRAFCEPHAAMMHAWCRVLSQEWRGGRRQRDCEIADHNGRRGDYWTGEHHASGRCSGGCLEPRGCRGRREEGGGGGAA